jgi:hypothetical protein
MTPIQELTEAEMRDRLAAKDAEIAMLRASHTELREIWLRDGWRLIETAPRTGTVVDLWGNNRDPDKKGGILLPLAATEGRYVDCFYGTPLDKPDTGTLVRPNPPGWYRAAHSDPGQGRWYERIWPTHWRPVPGRPT